MGKCLIIEQNMLILFKKTLKILTIFLFQNVYHLTNQSILKEISPGISLEGMMLKLKLQYFGHLMQRVDSLEKTLMLGGIGHRRRRGWQRMRWLDGITDSMDVSLGELREVVMDRCCDSWGREELDTTEWLNWTDHLTRSWIPQKGAQCLACLFYSRT